ncbi:MAG: M15 family metallopeptidase [Clostridiales bacterium]|nr:M15 family metallopeptidase [Clostridiales bacterium]
MGIKYSKTSEDNNMNPNRRKRYDLVLLLCVILLVLFVVYNVILTANTNTKQGDSHPFKAGNGIEPVYEDSDSESIPEGYKTLKMAFDDLSEGELVLIGLDNYYSRDVSDSLVSMYDCMTEYNSSKNTVQCYSVSDSSVIIRPEVCSAMNKLLVNFYKKTNISNINITSGYRSFSLQQSLFDREIAEKTEEEAIHWVAKPGYSEHHSGYAVDINIIDDSGIAIEYTGDGEYKYLNESAPDYGFVVRYQDKKKEITGIYYEPWHFRYVGLPHSKIMQEKDLCFEEYIDYLKDYSADGEHLKFKHKNKTYEIYYCKGYNVYVPENAHYLISGNNEDGFIVTVDY